MHYGDPDGHGTHGQLTVTADDERVICHECGAERKALGNHLRYMHGMTVVDYRRAHGLSTGQSLISPVTRSTFAAHAVAHPSIVEALRANADSSKGVAAMTREGQTRPQRAAIRSATGAKSRLGRPLTSEEIATLQAAPDVVAWTAAARRIVEGGGTTIGAVARATGVHKGTIGDRLRAGRDLRG